MNDYTIERIRQMKSDELGFPVTRYCVHYAIQRLRNQGFEIAKIGVGHEYRFTKEEAFLILQEMKGIRGRPNISK